MIVLCDTMLFMNAATFIIGAWQLLKLHFILQSFASKI